MPWRLYLAMILLAFLLTYVIILSYNIVEIHVVDPSGSIINDLYY